MSLETPHLDRKSTRLNSSHTVTSNAVFCLKKTNLAMKTDPAGNIKMDKSKSSEKIDGMVALVMALGCYMNDDSSDSSTYDDRGIVWI